MTLQFWMPNYSLYGFHIDFFAWHPLDAPVKLAENPWIAGKTCTYHAIKDNCIWEMWVKMFVLAFHLVPYVALLIVG